MSTASVRGRMTHRATIERRVDSEANLYGHNGPPEWEALDEPIVCFLYTRRTRGEIVTVEKTVGVEPMALMAPLGSDVTQEDRINGVEDRAGNVLLAGVQKIRDVERRHTHIEIMIEGNV